MTKVRNFATIPALTTDTIIPVLQNAVDSGNFKTTIQALMTFLISEGFIQEAIDKPASAITIEDVAEALDAENVEDAITEILALIADVESGGQGDSAYQVWLDAGNTGTVQQYLDSLVGEPGPQGEQGIQGLQGEAGPGGGWQTATISATGVTGTVRYTGTAPTLTGTQGNYTLNVLSGTIRGSVTIRAAESGSATNGNAFNLTINNADGAQELRTISLFDDGDNGRQLSPGEKGIVVSQKVIGSGSVGISIIEVGAQTSAFTIAIG